MFRITIALSSNKILWFTTEKKSRSWKLTFSNFNIFDREYVVFKVLEVTLLLLLFFIAHTCIKIDKIRLNMKWDDKNWQELTRTARAGKKWQELKRTDKNWQKQTRTDKSDKNYQIWQELTKNDKNWQKITRNISRGHGLNKIFSLVFIKKSLL